MNEALKKHLKQRRPIQEIVREAVREELRLAGKARRTG
jgi:hypothetical protein